MIDPTPAAATSAPAVLHVTEATGAGVLSYIMMVSSRQAERGARVCVLLLGSRPDKAVNWREQFHPAIEVVECAPAGGGIGALKTYAGAIRDAIGRHRPDALHLHSSIAGALGRIVVLRGPGRGPAPRVVYQPHGLSYLREDKSALARHAFFAIEWALARLPGALIGVSRGECDQLGRLGRRDVELIENGVRIDEIPQHLPDQRATGEGARIRVGTVNRVCAQKDPAFFAEVARRLGQERFEFVWVGDGEADLKATLEQAGVAVRGWLPRAQALAEMARFDIYLQPSRWEGMPLSLIEAQVAGVPAVAREVIGNREVIQRTGGGRLVGLASEAADAVRSLADDAGARNALGKKGRAAAIAEFSIDRIVDQLDALYRAPAPR